MNNLRDELDTLSKERVFVEFQKALSSNKPSKFFNVLREVGEKHCIFYLTKTKTLIVCFFKGF